MEIDTKVLILSIDGGGIRGVIPIKILQLLESDLQKNTIDIFDMYAGTSTGSIIVCALTGLKKTPTQILNDFYNKDFAGGLFKKNFGWFNFLSVILGSKYSGLSKNKILDQYFGDTCFSDLSKPTLVTSFNLTRSTAAIFKSNVGSMTNINNKVATITGASTAAPTYFPPVTIERELYVDGGICANNPAVASLSYALSLGHKLENIKILSLGTGKYINQLDGDPRKYSSLSWLKNGLIDDLFSGSSSVNDYNLNLILNNNHNNFLRINPVLDEEIHLDRYDKDSLSILNKIAIDTYTKNIDSIFQFLS